MKTLTVALFVLALSLPTLAQAQTRSFYQKQQDRERHYTTFGPNDQTYSHIQRGRTTFTQGPRDQTWTTRQERGRTVTEGSNGQIYETIRR